MEVICLEEKAFYALVEEVVFPDNYVQDLTNSQNYNRYDYVLNNPLKYSDPTGELTLLDVVAAVSIVTGAIIIATGNPVGWYLVGAGLIHFGIALEFNKETKDWNQASNQAGFTIGYTFDAPWGGQQQPDFSNTIEFTPVTEEDPFDGAIASNDPNFIGPMQSGGNGWRPDEDGILTFEEAIWWYRLGEGQPLQIDLNSIDLDGIRSSDFKGGINSSQAFNLFKLPPSEQGLIYGNITLYLMENNKVFAYPDYYDFDLKLKDGTFKRDMFTIMGQFYNGGGTPYEIDFYNSVSIKP